MAYNRSFDYQSIDNDDYLPIENEPMGNNYNPNNFESSVFKNNIYPYIPLSYKTSDNSYMDSWKPLSSSESLPEFFEPKEKK